jgi:hypothetical protein
MRILRSVVAILAGFWFMASAVYAGSVVAARVLIPADISGGRTPGTAPSVYLAAVLAVIALGSLMGGWLAARTAPRAPFAHACVLAAISAAMSVDLLIRAPDLHQLRWYAVAKAVIGALAILLGGKLRAAAAAAGGPVVA